MGAVGTADVEGNSEIPVPLSYTCAGLKHTIVGPGWAYKDIVIESEGKGCDYFVNSLQVKSPVPVLHRKERQLVCNCPCFRLTQPTCRTQLTILLFRLRRDLS